MAVAQTPTVLPGFAGTLMRNVRFLRCAYYLSRTVGGCIVPVAVATI
jgi:hypothetical protein